MTLGFHHVAISVPDLDRAARWYGAHLGFEVERRFAVPGGTEAMFLRRDGMRIELFRVAEPLPMPEDRSNPRRDLNTLGTKHFCFATDAYDMWKDDLAGAGIEIILEVGDGQTERGFFFNDCFGNVVEIVETRD